MTFYIYYTKLHVQGLWHRRTAPHTTHHCQPYPFPTISTHSLPHGSHTLTSTRFHPIPHVFEPPDASLNLHSRSTFPSTRNLSFWVQLLVWNFNYPLTLTLNHFRPFSLVFNSFDAFSSPEYTVEPSQSFRNNTTHRGATGREFLTIFNHFL